MLIVLGMVKSVALCWLLHTKYECMTLGCILRGPQLDKPEQASLQVYGLYIILQFNVQSRADSANEKGLAVEKNHHHFSAETF